MSLDALAVVRIIHLVAALFMAAPLYMLIIVNERGDSPYRRDITQTDTWRTSSEASRYAATFTWQRLRSPAS